MKNFLQVNRAPAAEKNFYLNLNQLASKTDGEPTVTRRSTDGQSQRQYTFGLMKYAAIITPAIRYVATLLVVLMVGFGQAWADTELTFSPTGKNLNSGTVWVRSANDVPSSGKVSNVDKTNCWKVNSNPIRISSSSANITKIVYVGCTRSDGTGTEDGGQVQVSADSTTFAKLTSGVTVTDADAGTQSSTDGIKMSKAQSSATTVTIEFDTPQRYIHICKASSSGKEQSITSIKVYTAASSSRTFKSGELVFFQDASGSISGLSSLWKTNTNNVYAYFWNDTEGGWTTYGDKVSSGDWNVANAIYKFVVPGSGKVFTKVKFTRGTSATDDDTTELTSDQTPATNKNMFTVSTAAAVDGKYNGSWGIYSNGPAIVGDMNNWLPDGGVFTFTGSTGSVIMNLEATTSYQFKVLEGTTWLGNTGTITTSIASGSSWTFATDKDNCTITTGEAGEYAFKWDNTNKKLWVSYPGDRFRKNTYLYFDASYSTNWQSAEFDTKFYFRYYDTDTEVATKYGDSRISDTTYPWVFYTTIPDDDYVGKVQIMRMKDGDHDTQWNWANQTLASSRSSALQNCLYITSEQASWSEGQTLSWKTYCPPMTKPTLTDNNGSTIYAGNGTSGNPYIVGVSTSISVSASASTTLDDPDMTAMYDFKAGGTTQQDTEGTTYTFTASSSDNTSYTLTVDAYNTYNSTNSTKNTSDALYYKARTLYTITYNKGSYGTGDEVTDKKAKGVNLTLRGVTFTRTGYTQTGWCTNSSGSGGTHYDLSASYTSNSNLTIYPEWTAKTTSVTLNPNTDNHGTGTNVVATATFDGTALSGFTAATPASGYALEGYYTGTTSGDKILNADGSYVKNTTYTTNDGTPKWKCEDATLTLYAHYVPTYTVTYMKNGGASGADGSVTGTTTDASSPYASGTEVTTIANSYSNSGYKFKWWNKNYGGDGEDFYIGEKFTISANTNLYAQWEEVASGWAYWCGDAISASPATYTDITGNGVTMRIGGVRGTAFDYNTGIQDATVVSKYSGTEKHANVIAVNAKNTKYVTISFTDGSAINSLKLGVCNKGGTKEMLVIYSTTADFSSGAGEKVAHNTSKYDQTSKNVIDFSPAVSNKYLYARIYMQVDEAVYGQTGGSNNIIRIYSIKAQAGSSCSAPAAPTISGTTSYTYGGTISLTATCATGTDASTTYTWYKGSDWATASVSSPVQAASTSGATFSKTAAMSDAGTYWCEAANSTCTSHNSSGYAITVAKASISPSLSYSSTTLTTGDNSSSPTVGGNTGNGTVTYSVTFSSPSGCATVNSSGVVTAVHPGTATITASIAQTTNYNSGTATASFTITKADISPTLSYASTSLVVGDETDEPTIDGNLGSGTVTYEVTSASPSGCITVDEDGKVTAVAAGSATVTATIAATTDYNSNTATADFTISACSPTTLVKTVITGYSDNKCTHTTTGTYKADPSIDLPNTTQSATIGGNSVTGYKLGSSGHYFYVNLSGAYLEAGDIIKVVITKANDAYKVDKVAQPILDLYYGSNTLLHTITGVSAAGEYSYTLTASDISTIGASVSKVGVYRPSSDRTQNPYVYSIEVIRPCSGYSVNIALLSHGSISADPESADKDEEVTLTVTPDNGYSLGTLTVTGDTSSDDVETTDNGDGTYTFDMPDEDVTVDATFSPNDYTITYHLNGASWVSEGADEYTCGTGYTLPVTGDMSNVGYTFGGWFDNSSCTGVAVTTISTSDYGNKEFWAKWTEITYTITYDANNGSATGSTSDTEGHYVTVADNGFELADHVFAGWNTAANGSGESYGEGEEIELTANMTLYAIWLGDYSVSWGNPQYGGEDATPNLGGKNYTITATIATWTGDVTDIELGDVTSGVTASITGTTSSPSKTVTITFAVGTSVVGDEIELSINIPAHGDYGAMTSTEEIDIERCGGSAGSSTIFTQDFSSATAVAYVNDGSSTYSHSYNTSSTLSNLVGSGTNLFTSLASSIKKGNIAVNSSTGGNSVDATGFFQVYGNGDNTVYWSLNRTSDFAATAPTALQVSMDIWYKNISSGSAIGVQFAVGDGFSDDLASGTSQATSKVHSGFGIYSNSAAKLYAYENIKTELYSTGITQSTWLSFVWIINNTGSDLTYNNPTGSGTTTLANDKFDLWVKTQAGAASTYAKVINAAAATTASKDLQNLYIGNNPSSGIKKHEFRLDNVVVKDISPSDSKVPPTLTWSPAISGDDDWDGSNSRLNKKTSDADFTFTAGTTSNTLGAITYQSSNTSVATVSETGKVHMVGAGDATITATLAEAGCYKEATATYAIRVVDDCDDEAGTISTEDLGCDGILMTVTGHTTTASTSYQWYKVGSPDATVGSDQDNFTTSTAGEYYVVVTNTGDRHCAVKSTNTIVVTAKAAVTASKIVDSWYVKNGRRTPDIALVQTTNTTDFTVAFKGSTTIWDPTNSVSTGFGGCPFRLGTDGIIYLDGQSSLRAVPTGMTVGDTTITITAKGCGADNNQSVDIKLHVQAATDHPSVAYVSLGTAAGAVTDTTAGYYKTAALYKYLDNTLGGGDFDLTAQNAYWSVDEKELKQHYSQFDAILITDDPSTDKSKTVDGKSYSYINAIGCLIDVRPILTMEAYVAKRDNWKAKGITGTPESPNPRQYGMKLQCKQHAIFYGVNSASSNVEVETIDGVDYWTVLMVDSTKSPYTGVAYNSQTGGADKPALQGFAATDVSEDLLLLGEIKDGALYAGVERQTEPAARLLVLGINAKALPSALTAEGKLILKNSLNYLLETDLEKVDDCSNYFTGATDSDWNKSTNWSKGQVPNSPTIRVRILQPCVISSGTPIKAASVDIATNGKSYHLGGGTCNGSLTINAGGALIVGGEIHAAQAPNFNTVNLKPTEEEDLVIKTNSSNQAALVFNNDKGETQATVELYSLGRKISSTYQYQYLAVPMSYIDVNPAFAGTGIYTYVWKEASGWERRGYYDGIEAFEGVGITTKSSDARYYTIKGTLASTETQEIALTNDNKGQNMIGNSWTAPIQISELDEDNTASEITKTVYIYCTGNGNTLSGDKTETAGQWLAIPFSAAGFEAWDGLKVIPAMQTFNINVTGTSTLTLDYDKVVRGGTTDLNEKLRAPKRKASHEGIDLMRIRVEDSKTHTDLHLFEGEPFSDEFDNGWEAEYMSGDNRSAKLYADVALGHMAVIATDDLEGTLLGFAPGQEAAYTFTFGGEGMGYYLNDLKLKTSTLIGEEDSYSFTYEEGDTNRFYISRTRIDAPQTTTGVTNLDAAAPKAQKILYNDKVYIIRGGKVYSIDGALVK